MTEDKTSEDITSYNCPECNSKKWKIQNRISSAAAYFNPEITHVECAECGYVDEAHTESLGE